MMFEQIGNFESAVSVAERLNHNHHFGFWLEFRFEEIQIVADGVEVDFQNGFVCFLFKYGHDLFKMKIARTFDQYGFVFEIQVVKSIGEFGNIVKSYAVDELVFKLRNRFANSYNTRNLIRNNKLGNL